MDLATPPKPASRIEFLAQPRFWLVSLVILFALVAGVALFVAKPQTKFSYNADQLVSAVPDKQDYRLNAAETDGAGQRFRWLQDSSQLFFPVSSNRLPLSFTLRLRSAEVAGGPAATTTVLLNGLQIGQIKPEREFKDYSFALVPAYADSHRLQFELRTDPIFRPPGDPRKLGNQIEAVSVDITEIWLPYTKRTALLWLLPALALGVIALSFMARSRRSVARLAGYSAVTLSAGAAAFMLFWLFLLSRVSYNGEANLNTFWVIAASAGYLAAFFGWVALDGLSWGKAGAPSLWSRLKARLTPWLVAHQALAALVGLFLVNAALSGVFYAKVFLEAGNLEPVARYGDGPDYIFIAHSFYNKNDSLLQLPYFGSRAPYEWTAYFPGFAIALRVVAYGVGWIAAGPLVSVLSTWLFAFVLWLLLRDFGYAKHPFWVACVALALPLRWLLGHSVGASEPLMLLFQTLSIYLFKKERYWLAGLTGGLALFVRPQGIFLWFGYLLFLAWEAGYRVWKENKVDFGFFNWKAFWGVTLIPLTLPVIFGIFAWRTGNFFAWFQLEKQFNPIPFDTAASGVGAASGLIYYYFFELIGLALLWRQKRKDIFWIGFGAFFYSIFLTNSNVLDYSLPFFPLLLIIPFARWLESKPARWLALPVLVAVFLYSWGILNLDLVRLDTWVAMKQILK